MTAEARASLSDGEIERLLVEILRRAIETSRVPLSSEKEAQAALAEVLRKLDIDFKREHRLAPGDILDFWLPDGNGLALVMEVKMNAARPAEIRRQLERYAAHPQVRGVILVSNRAMPLPVEIAGKPAHFISLGRAWL